VTFDHLLRERLDHDTDLKVRLKSLQRIETRGHQHRIADRAQTNEQHASNARPIDGRWRDG